MEKHERRKSKGSVAQASSIKRKLTAAENIKVDQPAEKSTKTEYISKEEFIAELNNQEYQGLLTQTTYCELMEVLRKNCLKQRERVQIQIE